ncbi:hypothetical protein D6827_01765 [Candidatus Parcubacteria bacterium]|nr:MAG: hypothetical protein D6827_01765 [Candidatus Parcubacteria bacterium]
MEMIAQGDSLFVEITVIDEATNAPLDLTGATVECRAESAGQTVTANCTITNAANGIFTASVPVDTLTIGRYRFQARVTLGGERQTVADWVQEVGESIFV